MNAQTEEKSGQLPPSYNGPAQTGAPQQPPPYAQTPGQPIVYGQPTGVGQPVMQLQGQGQPIGYIQTTGAGQSVVYGQPQTQIVGYGPLTGYPANTVLVQQPGPLVMQPSVRPADYLVLSIISVFFCWPMAICAIMYSCNSKTSADTGNFLRAQSEGLTARNVGIAAIIIGILILTVCIGVPVGIATASSSYYHCDGPYGSDCHYH